MTGKAETARKLAEQIARGKALLEAGDAREARKAFEVALRRDAASYAGQFGLARALFALENDGAEAAFARAARLAPDRAEPLLWQARVLRARLEALPGVVCHDGDLISVGSGEFEWQLVDEIFELVDEAAKLELENAEARLQRGLCYAFNGFSDQSGEGISDLLFVLDARPEDTEMQRAAAIGLIGLGELWEGVEALSRLEEEHGPLDTVALRRRAEALSSWLNENTRAEADFRELVRRDPQNADDHRDLARLLKKQGRIEEAIAAWRHIVTLPYSSVADYRALVRVLLSGKYDAEAEAACTDGLAAYPEHNCLYMLRGSARWNQGDKRAARENYDRALELKPDCTAALLNRGKLRRNAGDVDGMLEDWHRVLDKRPNDAKVHQHLADHYLSQEMWEQCLFHAGKALHRNLANARVRAMLGRARFELGEGEAALDDLDRAVTDDPDNASVRNERGIVLGKLGHLDLQIEDCRIALQYAPNDMGILGNLGVRLAETGRAAEAFDIFDDLVSRRGSLKDLRRRGECHRLLGRLPEAIADFECALAMDGISAEDTMWINDKLAAARGQEQG